MNETKTESPVAVETPKVDTTTNEVAEKPTLINKVMNILQANTLIMSLTADNKSLLTRLQEKEAEVTNLHKMSEEWASKIDSINQLETSYKAQLATQKTDFENQINQLKGKVTDATSSADKKAITIVANLGIPIDEVPKISNPVSDNSPEAKLAKFTAMPKGPEKTAYYNANRIDIVRATNAKAANK